MKINAALSLQEYMPSVYKGCEVWNRCSQLNLKRAIVSLAVLLTVATNDELVHTFSLLIYHIKVLMVAERLVFIAFLLFLVHKIKPLTKCIFVLCIGAKL